MIKSILSLVLLYPYLLFSGIIQSNGPFFELEDAYLIPQNQTLVFPIDEKNGVENSLWDPIKIEGAAAEDMQSILLNKINEWDGTALVLLDSITPFMTHYFHFLEHLLGIWQFGGADEAKNIKRVIFCSKAQSNILFPWKGINKINEKLIQILFPNAKVYTFAKVLKLNPVQSIHCEKMLISSRITAYGLPACTNINKMLGHSYKEISPSTLENLRQTVLSSLGISYSSQINYPHITYIIRPLPRALTSELESNLINVIENKVGIKVHKVDFATLSFEEQLRIVANTDILIGVHGNGLSHIVFLPPSATVFELFPSTGFTWDYALLAKIRGIDYYGHWAGDWVTGKEDPHDSRFKCHGNLNQTVDTLDVDMIVEIIRSKTK